MSSSNGGHGIKTPVITVSEVRRRLQEDEAAGRFSTFVKADNGLFFGREHGRKGDVLEIEIFGLVVTDEGAPVDSWPPPGSAPIGAT